MVTIGEDKILIEDHRNNVQIRFAALGGPEDPIEAAVKNEHGDEILTFTMSREDIEMFQMAFVNFLNTGWFDQEG